MTAAPPQLDWGDYALLDSGDGAKLERFGEILLDRPSPQSIWSRRLPKQRWQQAHAVYHRSSSGGGFWEERSERPASWTIELGGMRVKLSTTGFGHLGIFPEQVSFWSWMRQLCRDAGRPVELLNLFGYTGGSSLAAAQGGAHVTHCDASRGVVQWASENAELCGLSAAPIRWIVDDAVKFLKREERRERRYDAIVLDPPSFGRGPKGQVFKLEEHLAELLDSCRELLTDAPFLMLLSAHTPGVTGGVLRNLLEDRMGGLAGAIGCGEMTIPEQDGNRLLPSGTWAAWSATGELPAPPSFGGMP